MPGRRRSSEVNAEAGPSRPTQPAVDTDKQAVEGGDTIEIPSSGPEFFEYRRRLFLAGLPLPTPPRDRPLPNTIKIPLPIPDPLPSVPYNPSPKSSIGKLETVFDQDGAEDRVETWNSLQGILRNLTAGKALTRPLRLGLIIKILKVGWIRDGTWPLDPKTAVSAKPPESPVAGAAVMEVEVPGLTPPIPGLAGLMGYGYGETGSQILWPETVSMPKEIRELHPQAAPENDEMDEEEEMGDDHG